MARELCSAFGAVVCVACLAGSGLAAALGEGVPVDGKPFRGRLTAANTPWQLEFETEAGPRSLAAADLVCWGEFVDTARGPQVLLAGGGLLVADVRKIDRDKIVLESDLAAPLSLPLEAVAAVLLHPPSDRHRRDQLVRRLAAGGGETDRLILDNGDELAGTLTALDDDTLTLEAESGKLEIEVARVAAVMFTSAGAPRSEPGALCAWVGLADGSRLLATGLAAAEGQARLTWAGGRTLEAPTSAIVALMPLGGRAVYLSDLKPAGYKHIPYLQLTWPFLPDRNVAGDLLRGGGRLFLKGLGMHSASRLTYALDAEYRSLEAQLAVDDAAGGQGSVVFRVFVDDGDGEWKPTYSSPVVRGGDRPLPVKVDLSGAKRISLLVEFADRGDELDEADWLDARLIKK